MSNELRLSRPERHPPLFERIRRTNDAGVKYRSNRDFAQGLGYADYRNLEPRNEKANPPVFISSHPSEDHFGDITDMIPAASASDPSLRDGRRQVKGQRPTRHGRNTASAVGQKRNAMT